MTDLMESLYKLDEDIGKEAVGIDSVIDMPHIGCDVTVIDHMGGSIYNLNAVNFIELFQAERIVHDIFNEPGDSIVLISMPHLRIYDTNLLDTLYFIAIQKCHGELRSVSFHDSCKDTQFLEKIAKFLGASTYAPMSADIGHCCMQLLSTINQEHSMECLYHGSSHYPIYLSLKNAYDRSNSIASLKTLLHISVHGKHKESQQETIIGV